MRIIALAISGLITAFMFFWIGAVLLWQSEIGVLLTPVIGLVAGLLFTYYYAKATRISNVLLRSSLVCIAATIAAPLLAWPGSLRQETKSAFVVVAVLFGTVFTVTAIVAYIKGRH